MSTTESGGAASTDSPAQPAAPEPAAAPPVEAAAPEPVTAEPMAPSPLAADAPPAADAPTDAPAPGVPVTTTAPAPLDAQVIVTGPTPSSPSEPVDEAQLASARQVRRVSRLIAAVLLAIALVIVGQRAFEPVNLAAGKPWRTSSKWIDCDQSVGRCGPHVTRILFHTNEDESPWFELDLGAPTAFSSVTVVNRSDHMPERAVPLIVEVGDDQTTWRTVAERSETFSTWRTSFPTATARFVRLRVPRRTYLHLEAVRVHP